MLGIRPLECLVEIHFTGLVSGLLYSTGSSSGKEILASQKCFQEVQTNRFGKVGVEAGFLGRCRSAS